MNEVIEKILNFAVYAPSGDNCQPWEFIYDNQNLHVLNLPDADNPIFNFKQRGSFIAHGALIENIKQISPLFGYSAKENLFPNNQNPNLIATISFTPITPQENNNLLNIIRKRSTNRKSYLRDPLKAVEKEKLINTSNEDSLGTMLFIEEGEKKGNLGKAASVAEMVMLQYQPLHQAFFSLVCWDPKEIKRGMPVDTLELPGPKKIIFSWFSNWKNSKILRMIGMPSIIAKENSQIYSSSAAIGAIVQTENNPSNFVKTGMLLQKIWLTATALNLSLQPIAGVLYLDQKLESEGIPGLPEKLKLKILNAKNEIYKNFNNPNGHITLIFRIGKGDPPSATSPKLSPKITYTNNP